MKEKLMSQSQGLKELKNRKFALVYGYNNTGKTHLLHYKLKERKYIIYILNSSYSLSNCYYKKFYNHLETQLDRFRKNRDYDYTDYLIVDDFVGLDPVKMKEMLDLLLIWSNDFLSRENKHLYVISTDRMVVNSTSINDCFFAIKKTTKGGNDNYYLEYNRDDSELWEGLKLTGLNNFDLYQMMTQGGLV